VQVVLSDADLMQSALRLFEDRADKEWSLCDCTSFVVMQQLQITGSLTTDHHFRQAGFDALLLQEAVTH
jgi:predicted nucleic acid-binding protein